MSPLVRRFLEVTGATGAEDRLALEDEREHVSFAELGRRSLAVARAIGGEGLAGARVAVLAEPTVFAGYDGDARATREAFTDGWFRSGDTAAWTDDGYVRILGRTSVDILKSGGFKLSALEIEDALREHDAVADVAVVGLPDETWGEIAVAAVIPRPGRRAEVEEAPLRAWAKERLAAYKVPKHVVVREELPRSSLGKVLKPELRRELEEQLRRP